MRRNRAFSLVELLISITILAIVGGVAVSALSVVLSTFRQTDDLTTARSEIEFAFNELRPQFTNIGLGMPNSTATGSTSFQDGFAGLLVGPTFAGLNAPVSPDVGNTELLYAWAVPTGARLGPTKYDIDAGAIAPAFVLSADILPGIVDRDNDKSNPKSWMLFPSLKIPLHVDGSSNVSVNALGSGSFKGTLNGHSEIHLLKMAHLYVDGNERLVQAISGGETKALASNIISARFEFAPGTRVLTMTIRARGNSSDGREITESMTWRIKN